MIQKLTCQNLQLKCTETMKIVILKLNIDFIRGKLYEESVFPAGQKY